MPRSFTPNFCISFEYIAFEASVALRAESTSVRSPAMSTASKVASSAAR